MVNSAQIYGVSTKRLKTKPIRHELDVLSGTAVEYYVESLCMIKKGSIKMALVFMENN